MMAGNTLGSALKGRSNPKNQGPNHGRWNPDRSAFLKYSSQVRWLSEKTYAEHIDVLNPSRYPRTLCGVEGGYQLDHKASLKQCFMEGWSPEKAASLDNLQLIPWQENRAKWA